MSNENISSDLEDLIRQLEQVDEPAEAPGVAPRPARLIVATDWADAAVPLTVLKAFRAIIDSGTAVELAFAVPHTPTEADAQCVHVLLEGVDDAAQLAGLEVLSFEEAASQPYDSALVPNGNVAETISQVGGLIVRMHDLVRRLDGGDRATLNAGDRDALKRRFATFAG